MKIIRKFILFAVLLTAILIIGQGCQKSQNLPGAAGDTGAGTGAREEQTQQVQQQPAGEGIVGVIIQDFAFNPEVLTVSAGTTVRWTNRDSAPHTVNGDINGNSFASEILNKGDSFEFRFSSAGSYGYKCGLHPSMKGKIVVE